jgi:hypothetical protein
VSYWVVDVDGTLAIRCPGGRGPYEEDRVWEDLPNLPVIEIVQALRAAGHLIIVVSGRQDSCRQQTEEWLARHRVPYSSLYMRVAGDRRHDYEVKGEILEQIFRDHPLIGDPQDNLRTLDDRDQCVRLWRDCGLFCAQVAPGDF